MSFFESIKKFENKIGEKILNNLNCFINGVQNLKIYNNEININNKNIIEVYDEIKNSKKLKNLILFNKNNKNKSFIYSKNKNKVEMFNFFNKNKIFFKNYNNIFNKLDNIKPIIIQNIKNNIKIQLNKKILSNIRKRNNNNNPNQLNNFFSKTKIQRNNNNINNENINFINNLKSTINKKLNKISSCKNINNNIIIKKLNIFNTKNNLLYRNKSNLNILNGLKTNGIISPRDLKMKFKLHYKINSL